MVTVRVNGLPCVDWLLMFNAVVIKECISELFSLSRDTQ